MSIYYCHEHPDCHDLTTTVTHIRPDAVAVEISPFHPGGGGQVSDRGWMVAPTTEVGVRGIEVVDGIWWHLLEEPVVDMATLGLEPGTAVTVRVDPEHRLRVASLHTVSHVLNALVFDEFDGALVTGAQINGDGTGRMDFDLRQVDNDRLRALAAPVNEIIRSGVEVRATYVDMNDASTNAGLVRSLSVAPPPTEDGRLRIIEIGDIDRQACGGTHLSNTAMSHPIEITKIENKGRQNRRIRFAFV